MGVHLRNNAQDDTVALEPRTLAQLRELRSTNL